MVANLQEEIVEIHFYLINFWRSFHEDLTFINQWSTLYNDPFGLMGIKNSDIQNRLKEIIEILSNPLRDENSKADNFGWDYYSIKAHSPVEMTAAVARLIFFFNRDGDWFFRVDNHKKEVLKKAKEIVKLLERINPTSVGIDAKDIEKSIHELREFIDGFTQVIERRAKVYETLITLIKRNRIDAEQLAHSLVRELNKRFEVDIRTNVNGQPIVIPVNFMFNFIEFKKLQFDEPASFVNLEQNLMNISKNLPVNIGEIRESVKNTIIMAIKWLFANAQAQLYNFLIARNRDGVLFSNRLTIIVVNMFALGRVQQETTLVRGSEGAAATVKYFPGTENLKFELDFDYVLKIVKGEKPLTDLARVMLHELNHLFDNLSSNNVLDKIRDEGLARFSEIVQQPEDLRRRNFIEWYDHKPFETIEQLGETFDSVFGSSVYDIGLSMWMTISIYFLRKKYPPENFADWNNIFALMMREGVRRDMHQYLNVYRNLDTQHFIELYRKAAQAMGLRSVIGIGIQV
jgi:hypothetical protein